MTIIMETPDAECQKSLMEKNENHTGNNVNTKQKRKLSQWTPFIMTSKLIIGKKSFLQSILQRDSFEQQEFCAKIGFS